MGMLCVLFVVGVLVVVKYDYIDWIFDEFVLWFCDLCCFGVVLWYLCEVGDVYVYLFFVSFGVELFLLVFIGVLLYVCMWGCMVLVK